MAFITALEGQSDARFVLQTACFPDPTKPERGRLAIHLLVALEQCGPGTASRVDELCDDLLDLLAAPPVRWTFEPVAGADELAAILDSVDAIHLAEVARREEPCLPTRWEGGVGFGADTSNRTADRRLWSMWTFGPASMDLRRLGSVLLAQEAPVCIRVSLTPSAISQEERSAIEELSMGVGQDVPPEGLLRTSLVTLESLLYLRPLYDVRCVVASPEPLSRSMLSAIGHAISEPAVHGAPEPVLRGGFAVLRGDHDADSATLLDAYTTLSCGYPVPSLAPHGLEAHFKTLKYRPDYPARFNSIGAARVWCRRFFAWYNEVHYHSGIGYLRPADLHDGNHVVILEHRQIALDAAYAAHPERFASRPTPQAAPAVAWINRPSIHTTTESK